MITAALIALAVFAAVFVLLGLTAAAVVIAAGVLARRRGDGDIEALVEATREMTPRPQLEWTAADWAARDEEVSGS